MRSAQLKYQLTGWVLFVVCAAFFIASNVQNGDTPALIGSVVFLIGCIVFLVPLIREASRGRSSGKAGDEPGSRRSTEVVDGEEESVD